MSVQHTPTPWAVFQFGTSDMGEETALGVCVEGRSINVMMGDDQAFICAFQHDDERCRANAALIVRAVNSHQAMIDALEAAEALYQIGLFDAADGEIDRVTSLRRAALSLARGGEA